MKTPTIHFSGALVWRTTRGATITILPGWASCCSGDRAEAIRAHGHNTLDPKKVTCKKCLKNLELAKKVRPRNGGNDSLKHVARGVGPPLKEITMKLISYLIVASALGACQPASSPSTIVVAPEAGASAPQAAAPAPAAPVVVKDGGK